MRNNTATNRLDFTADGGEGLRERESGRAAMGEELEWMWEKENGDVFAFRSLLIFPLSTTSPLPPPHHLSSPSPLVASPLSASPSLTTTTVKIDGAEQMDLSRACVLQEQGNLLELVCCKSKKIREGLCAARVRKFDLYSIWLDSKLRLQQDPLLILEYFLWRKGFEYAISNHYDRHCLWEEVAQNKKLAGMTDRRDKIQSFREDVARSCF
ncbi:hypothetical protein Droror1_Dr00021067 [Drosera rotundifolia]